MESLDKKHNCLLERRVKVSENGISQYCGICGNDLSQSWDTLSFEDHKKLPGFEMIL